jgi:uncharacterized protein YndB with AHSA1/START domain
MMTEELIHGLQRTIVISAERATVFRFFTDTKRFADWWGKGSSIEGRKGGAVQICYPNGVRASGEVLGIHPTDRIVFTLGYESGKPIPPGSSRITISLKDHPEGTELTLVHDFSDAAVRDSHIQGWRYQLALFSNVAAKDQYSNVQDLVDQYFQLWNTKEADLRRERMEQLLDPQIQFQDRFSCNNGWDDLEPHLAAVHQFMPGLTIARNGEVQQCQGTAIARWITTRADGSENARGLNVFTLKPNGKISKVIGLWE